MTLRMEDTAGLRHSADAIEQKGIARSHSAAKTADVVLLLADPNTEPSAVLQEWERLKKTVSSSLSTKTLGIFTKSDLVPESQIAARECDFAGTGISTWLRTSALTGAGIHEAAHQIAAYCSKLVSRSRGEVLLTRLDQVNAVSAGIEHLIRAQSAGEIDLFASDVRHALHALGALIGETCPDDILGQIFSSFCIGK